MSILIASIVEPPSLPVNIISLSDVVWLILKSPELLVSVPYVVLPPALNVVPPLPLSKVMPFATSKPNAFDDTICKFVPSPVIVSPESPNSIDLLAPKTILSLNVAAPAADISKERALTVEPPSLPLIIKSLSDCWDLITKSPEASTIKPYEVPLSSKFIPTVESSFNSFAVSNIKFWLDAIVKFVPSPDIVSPESPNSIDLLAPKITLSLNVAAPASDISKETALINEPPSLPLILKSLSDTIDSIATKPPNWNNFINWVLLSAIWTVAALSASKIILPLDSIFKSVPLPDIFSAASPNEIEPLVVNEISDARSAPVIVAFNISADVTVLSTIFAEVIVSSVIIARRAGDLPR